MFADARPAVVVGGGGDCVRCETQQAPATLAFGGLPQPRPPDSARSLRTDLHHPQARSDKGHELDRYDPEARISRPSTQSLPRAELAACSESWRPLRVPCTSIQTATPLNSKNVWDVGKGQDVVGHRDAVTRVRKHGLEMANRNLGSKVVRFRLPGCFPRGAL